ncbi:hypothetical protein Pyrfu_0445 [Pyrolobus fumarii 1A]|uniref:CRISPR type III-B/RAMP module-associated protein Cmr5 n=1 Tax=Pyrolobus fumarii (strain DSM 11204 / 1A) TaxID=694429 RepID=G0EG68_PYRF1|nr:hypothetical protein [Pyrolobus fumarii]AEM38316.1 hypothetical protein Pyrfu_0445 [Pyrolobus fumarii 1A]
MSRNTPLVVAGSLVHKLYMLIQSCMGDDYCFDISISSERRQLDERRLEQAREAFRKHKGALLEALTRGERYDIKQVVEDELVRRSLRCVLGLYKCEALPTRAAHLTSHAASYGVASALIFHLSKADRSRYTTLYNSLSAASTACDVTIARHLDRECSQDGYTLILVLTVKGLEQLGILKGNLVDLSSLINAIVEAEENGAFRRSKAMILDFLVAMKRYLDGLYKG